MADRFELLKLVGRGGMGEVYQARDARSGELVALKLLRDGSSVRRFERESRIIAELRHPAIVRYLAHGDSPDGEPYLAMEWLEGENLTARLRRGDLTVTESLAIVRTVAGALAAAHGRGVVHRDVKPSNIFLVREPTGAVKLLDFGAAYLEQTDFTRLTHGPVGTPGYMSPEQAQGDEDVDARADIFSLGAVLYECLAGRPAFRGIHLMALYVTLILDEPTPLSDLRPDLPPELCDLVHHMLRKRRSERPADAWAVTSALDGLPPLGSRPAPSELPPIRMSHDEQALVGVVVVLPERSTAPGTDAHPGSDPSEPVNADVTRRLVTSLMSRFDAETAVLADGTFIAVLRPHGVATDLALRTARCGLALRRLMGGTKVCIATGRAVTSFGAPAGEAVDRAAARLAAAGESDEKGVFVDDVTASLLEPRFELRRVPAGWVLDDEHEPLSPTRTVLGKRLPFVGRERELAHLHALFVECIEERGSRAVLVRAPAGMGKSRLCIEALRGLEAGDARPTTWMVRADPMSQGSTLSLLSSLVRRALALSQGLPAADVRARLGEWAGAHLPRNHADRILPFLAELLAVGDVAARGEGQALADGMRDAAIDVVVAQCARTPLILVIEDLHWADPRSVRCLEQLLVDERARPLFMIATARPEVHEVHPLRHFGDVIVLGPLRSRAADSLVSAALGATTPELRARIVNRAEGNPFCLEETIRAVADGRGEVAESVMAMIQARLARLPAPARTVIRAASIYGEVFWEGGVRALVSDDSTVHELEELLELLVDREIIKERQGSQLRGERELAFRHALLREGAYSMLTEADRRVGHRLAGGWLERAGVVDAQLLAEHFDRGGATEATVRLLVAAAEQAFERHDLEAAAAAATRGIARAEGADRETLRRVLTLVDEVGKAGVTNAPQPMQPAGEPAPDYRFEILAGTHIFYESCAGRWSKDFTAGYIEAFKARVAPLLGADWGKLCNLDLWLPTHPDAASLLIEFLRWSLAERMTAVAYVISAPEARLQARRIIESSDVKMRAEFFATEAEGRDWLIARGL